MPTPYCLYTIAFDTSDSRRHSKMALLFVTSLLRTGFSGEIIIFKNHEAPILPRGTDQVREIPWSAPPLRGAALAERAAAFRYEAMSLIPRTDRFERVMYADCDHLALRNIDHLFVRPETLTWTEERGSHISWPYFRGYLTEDEMARSSRPGSNSGLWSVRGDAWAPMAAEVRHIMALPPVLGNKFWGDQPAWNRMLYDGHFDSARYPLDEIQFPLAWDTKWQNYIGASLLHFAGVPLQAKWWLMCALFSGVFAQESALEEANAWLAAAGRTRASR